MQGRQCLLQNLEDEDDEDYEVDVEGHLTINAENILQQRNLVLGTASKVAWLFIRPGMPEQILLDD